MSGDVVVAREAGGYLSAKFCETGDVVSATREVVQGWVDTVNTLTAQRDCARDIAARLGLMVAEVERILSRQSHTIGCPRGNRPSAECWCGLDDLRAAIDGYSDDDSAPDPQHPAYKALHRDAEVGT